MLFTFLKLYSHYLFVKVISQIIVMNKFIKTEKYLLFKCSKNLKAYVRPVFYLFNINDIVLIYHSSIF